MNRSVLIAGLLVLALAAWLVSGLLWNDEPVETALPTRTQEPMLVEVQRLEARPVTRFLVNQAEVQPFRETVLRAETAGEVAEILARKGERVEAGAPVVQLALGDREARLEEARALLAQREAEYEASRRLSERGVAPEQQVRERYARLQAARAAIRQIEEEIEDTTIEAPFDGVINAMPVEEGEFVTTNAEIATLIDNDPLIVEVQIPQQSVEEVELGAPAAVRFVTGQDVVGTITFISANADQATRTFAVEIEVANADAAIPSGISAETRIPVAEVPAHFLSPALLSLSTEGVLGVKTVSEDGVVRFHPIDIVRAEADGIWVSGLPDQIRLITVGQGFVQAGERVEVMEVSPDDDTQPIIEPPEPPEMPGAADAPSELLAADTRPREIAGPAVTAAAPDDEAPRPVSRGQEPIERETTGREAAGRAASGVEAGTTPESATRAAVPAVEETAEPPTAVAEPSPVEGQPPGADAPADVAAAPPTRPSAPDPPMLLSEIQAALNDLGYDAGPPDGIMGPRTRTALRAFQADSGLPTTGEPSPRTVERLSTAISRESAEIDR